MFSGCEDQLAFVLRLFEVTGDIMRFIYILFSSVEIAYFLSLSLSWCVCASVGVQTIFAVFGKQNDSVLTNPYIVFAHRQANTLPLMDFGSQA